MTKEHNELIKKYTAQINTAQANLSSITASVTDQEAVKHLDEAWTYLEKAVLKLLKVQGDFARQQMTTSGILTKTNSNG